MQVVKYVKWVRVLCNREATRAGWPPCPPGLASPILTAVFRREPLRRLPMPKTISNNGTESESESNARSGDRGQHGCAACRRDCASSESVYYETEENFPGPPR
jgi:hypothetical protein